MDEAGFPHHSSLLFTVYQGVRGGEKRQEMERKRRSNCSESSQGGGQSRDKHKGKDQNEAGQ